MRSLRRTTVAAVLALGVGIGGGFAVAGCDRQPAPRQTAEQRQLAADIAQLRGDDGLFIPNVDLGAPGLYTSAYGLTALAGAGGDPTIALDGPAARSALDAELKSEPLWGRFYLVLVGDAAQITTTNASDAAALASMLNPAGYYADPATPTTLTNDEGYRLSATSAALHTLRRLGAAPQGADRTAVRGWLDAVAPTATRSLTARLQWTDARTDLGLPAPSDTAAALSRWWSATGAPLSGPATGDQLLETCSYVQLAVAAGVPLDGQRAALERLLDPAATRPGDAQAAYSVVRAWKALGAAPDRLAPVRQILQHHRLPNGLVTSVQERRGDLLASEAVTSLRAAAGLAVNDKPLVQALSDGRDTILGSSNATTPGLWLATYVAAGGAQHDPAAQRIRGTLTGALPQPVTLDNARDGDAVLRSIRALGIAAPTVHVAPWSADSAEQRYFRNLVLVDLAGVGQLGQWPNPPAAGTVAGQGLTLLGQGSLRQAAAALQAAGALGWRPSADQSKQLTAGLTPLQGCPGTPSLYREASVASCNVYSTLAAWQIRTLHIDFGRALSHARSPSSRIA
jgi:hypothetical protein